MAPADAVAAAEPDLAPVAAEAEVPEGHNHPVGEPRSYNQAVAVPAAAEAESWLYLEKHHKSIIYKNSTTK